MQIKQEAAVGARTRRWAEVSLALAIIGIGVLLTGFPVVFKSSIYDAMRLVMPGRDWGMLFTTIGTARVVFLIVNGHYPQSPSVRFYLSLLTLFVVWLPLAASFLGALVNSLFGGFGDVRIGTLFAIFLMDAEVRSLFALSALCESYKNVQ